VYSNKARELEAARHSAGLADISALAKVSFQGPGVGALTQQLCGASPALRPLGVANLDAPDLSWACRLTELHLLVVGKPEARLEGLPSSPDVVRSHDTFALAAFCLMGPRAEDVLRRLTALDIQTTSLPEGTCAATSVAGVGALLVRPAGMALPQFHIYPAWDVAEYLWEEMFSRGQEFGITPLGWDALFT
jgi:glycine cleavage system aminomethyltransferase T